MSCRCPIQPDYCVDEPITTLDCAACTTCVLSMNADSLRTVLAHRDRLIERLHATRSTLMAERDSALDQRNEARFRPVAAAAAANEVLLTGRRVLVPGSSVVAAVDEGVRYGRKAAGYHGGAAAAEVTVPVIVLARDPDPLAALGWVAAPPQAPRWWYEPVAASESSVAEPLSRWPL